jgi:2-iminobutanoate/2-iminopropanoate deaminase
VRAGEWLVVSGQVGVHGGSLIDGGVAAQTRQALANLRGHLEAEGATLAHVVKTTVFVRHISDFPAMNAAYAEVFGDHRPARSTVAVAGLPLGGLIEIEAWAYVGRGRGKGGA